MCGKINQVAHRQSRTRGLRSLLLERTSEEIVFLQDIFDAEGRRWSLRFPASELPEDIVQRV